MNRLIRASMSLGTATVAAVFLATCAFAYLTGTGNGTASGTTTTLGPLITLTAATPTSALYPGGSTDVALTMTNTNLYDVPIGSLTLDTTQGTNGFAVDAPHNTCNLSVLSFTTQTTGWTVPLKIGGTDGTLPTTLTNALSMTGAAATTCQGATFTVYLTAGP
jgi:hypothetical protein